MSAGNSSSPNQKTAAVASHQLRSPPATQRRSPPRNGLSLRFLSRQLQAQRRHSLRLRVRSGCRRLGKSDSRWAQRFLVRAWVARVTHMFLYTTLLAMPVLGFLAWITGAETFAELHTLLWTPFARPRRAACRRSARPAFLVPDLCPAPNDDDPAERFDPRQLGRRQSALATSLVRRSGRVHPGAITGGVGF